MIFLVTGSLWVIKGLRDPGCFLWTPLNISQGRLHYNTFFPCHASWRLTGGPGKDVKHVAFWVSNKEGRSVHSVPSPLPGGACHVSLGPTDGYAGPRIHGGGAVNGGGLKQLGSSAGKQMLPSDRQESAATGSVRLTPPPPRCQVRITHRPERKKG